PLLPAVHDALRDALFQLASVASTTGFAYGGHLSAGLEAHLGPGNLVAEVRAGASLGDPGVWSDNTNVYGIAAVLGYLFLF
ncbi:MAG: hypothetical protein D6806_16470, partial [Deltaproteobacteria bacterium]